MPVELVMTQFADQVRWRFFSQLIKDIQRILQKLLQDFNDTSISTSFVLPSARFFLLFLS